MLDQNLEIPPRLHKKFQEYMKRWDRISQEAPAFDKREAENLIDEFYSIRDLETKDVKWVDTALDYGMEDSLARTETCMRLGAYDFFMREMGQDAPYMEPLFKLIEIVPYFRFDVQDSFIVGRP